MKLKIIIAVESILIVWLIVWGLFYKIMAGKASETIRMEKSEIEYQMEIAEQAQKESERYRKLYEDCK